ncbi:helix-turn-helix domain-containing protein [Nocardia wallacei]|uniref:helix-turn-helix domain-containing protein n=1 Tax=Nocardia wallacei TaxID=480035 RepID=UPI0024539E22|nr:helix-turn-helix transcriptional regulator [Nocardia wallacei]
MREVKLAATLKRLIDEGEYRGNRRQVCAELGITTAALSQYIRGQTTPGLDKLIAISDLFQVSLDYLIFGEDAVAGPTGTLDYGPLARYMEASLASSRADIAAQSAFVSKVGSIIADQIGVAVQTAAKRPTTFSGMLDQDQALELERYSKESTIAAMDLDADLVRVESEIEEGVAVGRFLTVVAENLSKKRSYRFVLSPKMRDMDSLVGKFRALLVRQQLSSKDIDRCTFSVAADLFYVGFCLFRLDVASFRAQSPILYQYVKPYIGADDLIGFIEPGSSTHLGMSLMDEDHRHLAALTLERLIP